MEPLNLKAEESKWTEHIREEGAKGEEPHGEDYERVRVPLGKGVQGAIYKNSRALRVLHYTCDKVQQKSERFRVDTQYAT